MSEFQAKTSLLSLLKEEDNLVDKYNTLVEHIDNLKQYIEDIKTLLNMSEDLKISLITRNQIELGKQESELTLLSIKLISLDLRLRNDLNNINSCLSASVYGVLYRGINYSFNNSTLPHR